MDGYGRTFLRNRKQLWDLFLRSRERLSDPFLAQQPHFDPLGEQYITGERQEQQGPIERGQRRKPEPRPDR